MHQVKLPKYYEESVKSLWKIHKKHFLGHRYYQGVLSISQLNKLRNAVRYSSSCKQKGKGIEIYSHVPLNVFATFSYILQKVVKILTGLKLENSFFLEVPLWNEETSNFSIIRENTLQQAIVINGLR